MIRAIPSLMVARTASLLVQTKTYGSTTDLLTHSITIDLKPIVGNLMLLAVDADATATTPAGWSIAQSSINQGALYLYYKTAGAAESTTISVTLAGTTSAAMIYTEVDMYSTLDQHNSTSGTGTTSGTTPTITTTSNKELIVSCLGIWENTGHTSSPILSWSNSFRTVAEADATISGHREALGMAVLTTNATGSFSTTVTWTSTSLDTYDLLIASFS